MYNKILLVIESLTQSYCPFTVETINFPFFGNLSSPFVSYLLLHNIQPQLSGGFICSITEMIKLSDSFAVLPHGVSGQLVSQLS